MVHGPCGYMNPNSPCMGENQKCSKRYPKAFTNSTITEDDGYPLYRQRDFGSGGFKSTVLRNSTFLEIANRFIVPYNPLPLKTFNAHINVEWCHSVKSIKYICKYINKGSDQALRIFQQSY
ncbi:unnamed protein product [Macrosiphum euphorbiae]|uniref:Uncharacterized protein n=1 Tax=Macrosiphum euphorbiae TaxID=13131 RepID=A0AAV0XZY0_9HEMI|nr:unnamed protein product [Macrosiphum euphorbiae]